MSDITLAVSEDTFRELFTTVRDNISGSTSGNEDFGAFSVSWNLGFHLEGGTLDLTAGSVMISELDVVYDPVYLSFGIDIPEVCTPSFCLIRTPLGCALRLPRYCIFDSDPDISVPLDISGLVESEISGAFAIKTRYFVDPGRTIGMTDLDAEDAGVPNKWQFVLDPIWLDIDPIDFADTIGNILDAAISNMIDGYLWFVPGWVLDVLGWGLGLIVGLVREILDIVDDVDELLSEIFGTSIGLLDLVATAVAEGFADKYPIFEFEDPFPILEYDDPLIPVKVPIKDVKVIVTDDEMIVSADVGG